MAKRKASAPAAPLAAAAAPQPAAPSGGFPAAAAPYGPAAYAATAPPPSTMAVNVIVSMMFFAGLLLQTYLLGYLVRLERIGCACATDWRRSYMMWFFAASIVLNVANVSLLLSSGGRSTLLALAWPVGPTAALLVFAATVVYIVCALQYTARLRREKCACSEAAARDVMEVLAVLQSVMLGLGVLMSALTAAMAGAARIALNNSNRGGA
jgi:hypothetical protein